ncbi:unnamed protein product [Sphagnum troendelagicum]|uniref:Uncharacterized protein n=1 Tax=Sphagnum troendelagicum TaxID=128251 RepID=A0ABP0TJ69_9BRYO
MADDHQDSTYYAEYEKEKSSIGNDNNNNGIQQQQQPPWTTKTNSDPQHGYLDPDQEIRQRTYYINIPIRPLTAQVADEHLERLSLYYSSYGVLFVLVGVVAILVPLFFGFPIDQLLAWLLVLGGAVTLLNFFLICGAPGTLSFLLLGALHLGVGLWLLLQPVPDPTTLLFVIAGWFLAHGILKFVMTCQLRHVTTWPAVMISGLTSIILAFVMLTLSSWLFTKSRLKVIGFFFGADLCLTGVAMVLIAFMARLGHRAKETHQPLLAESARVAASA